jgi:glycosyltransferase involved in cell wall biosynthesis
LIRFLKEQGVRALIAEYLHSFLPYLDEVQAAGIQWFSFGHGYDVSSILRDPVWAKRLKVQVNAAGVLVRAESIRRRMIEFGLSEKRVHVVFPGVDVLPVFPDRSQGNEVQLVSVGRMVAKKSPLNTLEAFRIACARKTSLRLHFVGEGPLLEPAREFVKDHGLEESAILYGAKSFEFVMDLMRRADVYVQHSIVDTETGDEEGMPGSILEAMGVGLPVVSTLHAGIPEAVRDGIDGYLVAEGDVEGMAARMVDMAESAERRIAMGRSAWMRATEHFTWEHERSNILRVTQVERYL